MTAPPNASPVAEELAATCVQVEARGVLRHVRIVPPGTDPAHSLPWATCSEAEVRRHVADAVRMLAPFVDLGLARGRATPGTLAPLTDRDRHDLAAILLELCAERDRARSVADLARRERDEAVRMATSWERENEDLGQQIQTLRARVTSLESAADADYARLCRALDLPPGTTFGECLNRARLLTAARAPATPSAEPPGAYFGALADPALWVHAPREVAPVDHDRHDDDDGDPG